MSWVQLLMGSVSSAAVITYTSDARVSNVSAFAFFRLTMSRVSNLSAMSFLKPKATLVSNVSAMVFLKPV